MCATDTNANHKKWHKLLIYFIVITGGILSGVSEINQLHLLGTAISDITVKLFKVLSLPLISLSLIVTITSYYADLSMKQLGKKVLTYTLGTTIAAAAITLALYVVIGPLAPELATNIGQSDYAGKGYLEHISKIIPSNIIEPFINHNVFGVLLVSIMLGIAIRQISDKTQKDTIVNFFRALHSIFIVLTKYLIKFVPIALFGFVMIMVKDLKQGLDFTGIGGYLAVVLLANFVQGFIILPAWLKWKGIKVLPMLKGSMPALSLAFFSKSSAATLPVTIESAKNNLGVRKETADFVLPLCTTINMNGCAAFILATVLFVMQSQGIVLTPFIMISWVLIATIAAIGNAGVPMGCFFLSASLLSSMGLDLMLLGIILPFYGIIDMVETSLNVWSDLCVTKVTDNESR